VKFTYDISKVDLTKAGTYYATYTATDQAGNTATSRRKVVVNHDQADTKALVQSVAAGLSGDPEEIRDYVRDSIKYSSSWGDEDPVWYGFKNKKGNCYVHALCLQELLEEKGYSTKLIWVTDKSHYWLLIKLNGVWKHIDATPGVRHTKYSLMDDTQRLETLSGRKWDTSQWPACE
jgi:transglutaminase-like putative cysteine protease